MEMFLLEGGRRLLGRVAVSGSKNAALPMMAAAILADGPVLLHGVPRLVDVGTLAKLLRTLGLRVDWEGASSLRLEVVAGRSGKNDSVADYDLVRRMRASVCVLGPLLAKRGWAKVSLPGGCQIGDRPIDLHLKGLRALGAEISVERGYVIAEAKRRLRGAEVDLGGPFGSTVTGTCNVMAAAAIAEGTTKIIAAACEPEVVELGAALNQMGANISGLGTSLLQIEGVSELRGIERTIIPDRIEAATLIIAVAMTGGDVVIDRLPVSQMGAVMKKLEEIGVCFLPVLDSEVNNQINNKIGHNKSNDSESLRVTVPNGLRAANVTALPYPGLPTDVQAQLMTLLTLAEGSSVVTDQVFSDRFMHVAELGRLGAKIRRSGATAVVSGVSQLSGADVMASDLRASAALVLAGLAADGRTVIRRIYHLDRGYDRLDEKLNDLGASIRRVQDER